jgi:hypothetical protein
VGRTADGSHELVTTPASKDRRGLERWFKHDLREEGVRARMMRLIDNFTDESTRVLIPGREQELVSIRTEIKYFENVVSEVEQMSTAAEVRVAGHPNRSPQWGDKWIGKQPIKSHLLTKPRAEESKY